MGVAVAIVTGRSAAQHAVTGGRSVTGAGDGGVVVAGGGESATKRRAISASS
jgi:hypothetical protein